jgi:hypothetical protein
MQKCYDHEELDAKTYIYYVRWYLSGARFKLTVDAVDVTVNLTDQYGNPWEGRLTLDWEALKTEVKDIIRETEYMENVATSTLTNIKHRIPHDMRIGAIQAKVVGWQGLLPTAEELAEKPDFWEFEAALPSLGDIPRQKSESDEQIKEENRQKIDRAMKNPENSNMTLAEFWACLKDAEFNLYEAQKMIAEYSNRRFPVPQSGPVDRNGKMVQKHNKELCDFSKSQQKDDKTWPKPEFRTETGIEKGIRSFWHGMTDVFLDMGDSLGDIWHDPQGTWENIKEGIKYHADLTNLPGTVEQIWENICEFFEETVEDVKKFADGDIEEPTYKFAYNLAGLLGACLAGKGAGKIVREVKGKAGKTTAKMSSRKGAKFSEMTPEQAIKTAKEYRTKSPIQIPESASMKPVSKTGYEQITYKWKDGGFNYEVRWHTRTPSAPPKQGNTWVISRKIPGSGGQKPQSFYKTGNTGTNADWVTGKDWFEAMAARKAGTATPEQIKILDKGHWKEH